MPWEITRTWRDSGKTEWVASVLSDEQMQPTIRALRDAHDDDKGIAKYEPHLVGSTPKERIWWAASMAGLLCFVAGLGVAALIISL